MLERSLDPQSTQGNDSTDPDYHIDDLVARALEIAETEGKDGVERFLAEHEADAPTIRRHLSRLQAAGLLDDPVPKESHPEEIADFRILAKLGKGGMGVVYLAEEKSLGRRVALKLVRPDQLLFPGARERFQREVQTVAKLAHSNIVPVYSVGEQDGVPWFAMEYVAGATLAELIERCAGMDLAVLSGSDLRQRVANIVSKHDSSSGDKRPSSGRTRSDSDAGTRRPSSQGGRGSDSTSLFSGSHAAVCTRIAHAAAQALGHAHERGVLHRDVKPSNMLITTQGRVLLFDFGLATHDDGGKLTRTGQRLGSLAYMSPEQLDGNPNTIDARSDIYSLGVSLYEILTFRLPFLASSGEALIAAIRDGRPIPPRTINPTIPKDLETVVLKAMDPIPDQRYANAIEFAEDLENVLELRPIHARRPSSLLRLWRLIQRRPLASALATLFVISSVTGAIAYDYEQRRSAKEVKTALDRAERSLNQALTAVDSMLIEVGHESLRNVPQVEPVRRALLEKAVTFYESFLIDNPGNDQIEYATMVANLKLADIYDSLGLFQKVQESCLRSLWIMDSILRKDGPATETATAYRVRAYRFLERARRELDDPEGAADAGRRAVEVALAGIDRFPKLADLKYELAGAYDSASRFERANGNFAGAEQKLRDAIELQSGVVADNPNSNFQRGALASYLNNLADLLFELGRSAESVPLMEQCCAVLDVSIQNDPSDSDAEIKRAMARMNLAKHMQNVRGVEDSITESERALAEFESLKRRFPDTMEVDRGYLAILDSLATLNLLAKKPEVAVKYSERSIALKRQALEEAPGSRYSKVEFATTLANYCNALQRLGRNLEAAQCSEEGITLLRPIVTQNARERLILRALYQNRIQSLLKLDRYVDAAEACEELLAALGEDPNCVRIAGGLLARGLGNIANDSALEQITRERKLAKQTARAVEILTLAKQKGALTNADLERGGDYEALRQRPEFADLIALPEVKPAPAKDS